MGKFDGILIVSDLDGTLLNNKSQISQRNRDAIAYFEREGGHFTYISGRVARCMAPILQKMTPPIPVGSNNGMVYDPHAGEWVDFEAMTLDVLPLVEDILAQHPDAGLIVMGKQHIYFSKPDPISEHFQKVVGLPDRFDWITDIKEPFCKVLFTYPADRFEELRAAVDAHPISVHYELVRSDPQYYEIMPKGCNKGRALQRLAAYLGIDPERTIAVGDNENDMSMFRAAKLGIAVANASDAAKSAADMVLDVTNEDGAIAAIIERLDSGRLVL
ncbi:MAG: Cof-type HAD-IIB family hydrolase [Clostridia bacterium]|nr:Cof-type HAD-IIB family hydrolase [Clostridia bacterium]